MAHNTECVSTHEEHTNNDNSGDIVDELNTEFETGSTKKEFSITGRRMIDIAAFWRQIQTIKHAPLFNCTIEQCEIVNEKIIGFQTVITIKCKMCGTENDLNTDSNESEVDVNSAAVLG